MAYICINFYKRLTVDIHYWLSDVLEFTHSLQEVSQDIVQFGK